MNPRTEQEWQFSASTLDAVRGWLTTHHRDRRQRHLVSRAAVELDDTYFDTADWRIHRAGFALRLRIEREAESGAVLRELTLKAINRSSGTLAKRIEITEPVDGEDMSTLLAGDTAMAARLRDLVGQRELRRLFRARTRRERWQLLEADSDLALAEVALDETAIEAAGGVARMLKRVEVECLNAEPEAIAPWVEDLRAAANLEPVEASKFGTGLEVAGLHPAPALSLEVEPLQARQSFARAQRALLARYFLVVANGEPAVRIGSADAIHDMRVAARHLDVLLRSLSSRARPWMLDARVSARELIHALGDVRDGDVQIARIGECTAELPERDRSAFGVLLERLTVRRQEARQRLLDLLDSESFSTWRVSWSAQLGARHSPHSGAGDETAGKVARELVREAARKLWKSGDVIGDESTSEELHAVRKNAKRLRYLLEAFAELWREPAAEHIRALGKLQTVLGDYHDAAVLSKLLADFATEESLLSPAASFAVGRIVQRELHALDRHRRQFAKAYRRVRRRRWRALRRAMDDAAEIEGDAR